MLVSGPTVLVINLTVRVVSHRQAAMAWFSFLFLSAGDGLKAEGSTTHLPDVYRWVLFCLVDMLIIHGPWAPYRFLSCLVAVVVVVVVVVA